MRRRDFLIRLGLVAGGVGGAVWLRDHVLWKTPDVLFADGRATDWLPYAAPQANIPVVLTRINGQPVRALVDSGAQYSVIDRSLVQRLGLTGVFNVPMVAYGVGGEPQIGRGVALDVVIGEGERTARLDGLRAAVLNLGPLAHDRQGLGASLVLGQDVLGELALEMDTGRRRMRFMNRQGWTPAASLAAMPVRRAGRALETGITIEGATVQAVVDTGASALLAVTRETAEGVGLLDGRPREAGRSIVLGGVVAAQTARARTVTIGDQLHRNVPVSIYADVIAPGFPRALVGMGAFARQEVALDLGGPGLFVSRPLDITVAG